MRDEDIEILEDFSDNQNSISNNQFNPSMNQQFQNVPNTNMPNYNVNPGYQDLAPDMPQSSVVQENSSVSEFEKMVTEANNPEPERAIEPINNVGYSNEYNYQNNNYNDLNYVNDTNNELVQQSNNDDLTITAIYPNGFVVPDQEEQEDNRVVKPKKQKGDLFLVIIVAVLAVTLIAMLIMFYL